MNQQLQFQEDEYFCLSRQAVCFTAILNGLQINCAVSRQNLDLFYGCGDPLDVFKEQRWIIEEAAEKLIYQGQDDDDGWYWIGKP